VWAFHGEKDKSVPFSESKRVVEVLERCGGMVRFSVFPDAGHEVCTLAYENDELYKWLLEKIRVFDIDG
jgi:dipeptidyl aminopeptidase/acylaminoacyl peptidase